MKVSGGSESLISFDRFQLNFVAQMISEGRCRRERGYGDTGINMGESIAISERNLISVVRGCCTLEEDGEVLSRFAASQAVRSKDNEKIIGSQSLYMEGNCLSECSLDLDLYLTRNPVPPDFENTRRQYVVISVQMIILKLAEIYRAGTKFR